MLLWLPAHLTTTTMTTSTLTMVSLPGFYEPLAWYHQWSTTTLPFYLGHLPPPSFYYETNGSITFTHWQQRLDDDDELGLETHLCLKFPSAFILIQDSQGGTGLETQIHLEPQVCFFSFLLSFFPLLINNLLLQEPRQQMATGTIVMMQMKDRAQRLKPSVCFFFSFKFLLLFFFSTKCLFSRDLPQWQWMATTTTINETNVDVKCPPSSPHKQWAKDWAEQQKGQQGLKTWHVSSPSVCFFSFFIYFLSSKYLFASRTAAL